MGMILEINQDEEFPADMILLYAENEEGEFQDFIYVDTVNLDGENALKKMNIIDSQVKSREKMLGYYGEVHYDAPDKDLTKWAGQITSPYSHE